VKSYAFFAFADTRIGESMSAGNDWLTCMVFHSYL